MTLLFKELAGSPTELYGTVGMKAQRRLLCAYEDRLAAVAVLLGQGGVLGGQPAAQYPGRPAAYVIGVRVEPFEKRPDDQGQFDDLTADLNNYSNQFAQLVVELRDDRFGPRPEPAQGPQEHDPQLSHGLRRRVHSFAGPGPAMAIRRDDPGAAGGRAHAADPDRRAPRHLAPRARSALGRHPHVARGRSTAPTSSGAAAETVLFDGARAEPRIHRPGQFLQPQFGWKITYVFREKAIKALNGAGGATICGWNHTYRDLPAPSACWDRLVDHCGNTLYATVDFTPLFQFSATSGT